MRKLLSISLIPVLALMLFGAFMAYPAYAQTGVKDNCTLVKDVTIKNDSGADIKVSKGVIVIPGSADVVATTAGTLATEDWGTLCLINTINVIVDWVFILLLVIAVGLIAAAGVMWTTAGGDSDKQKTAGKMIQGAVVGIVIALLARMIPALIAGILT